MMSPEEFEEWAKQLNLTDAAKKEIQRIRDSPPARRVGGGRYNVSGKFSSRKMGVTIQFESHKVELPAIYLMEYDENVIEYYDQPPKLKLIYYQSKNGKDRKMAYMYTADFFVIEKNRAYWVEWKTEEKLIDLSQEKPDRYYKENGQWKFTPGINYASELSLNFYVRSSAEINWELKRNLSFLEDYIEKQYIPDSQIISGIKEKILANPGLTLSKLIQSADGQYTSDDIYALIVQDTIYIDIYNTVIAEQENVKVFLNKEQSRGFTIVNGTFNRAKKTNKIELKSGNKILWGEKIWTILNFDHSSKNIFLYSTEDNNNVTVPIHIFEGYISEGYIKGNNEVSDNESEIKKNYFSSNGVRLT